MFNPLDYLPDRQIAAIIGESAEQFSRLQNPDDGLSKPGPNRHAMNRIQEKWDLLNWAARNLGTVDFDFARTWKIRSAFAQSAPHVRVIVSKEPEQGYVWRDAATFIRRQLEDRLQRGPATLVTAGGPTVASMVHGFFPNSLSPSAKRHSLSVRASHRGRRGPNDATSAVALVKELGKRYDGQVLAPTSRAVPDDNSLFVASLGGRRHSLVAELLSRARVTPDEFIGDIWLHPVDDHGRELRSRRIQSALRDLRPFPELAALPSLARSGQVVLVATSRTKGAAVRACLEAGLASVIFLTPALAADIN